MPLQDDPWMAAMRAGDYARAWSISDNHLCARRARGDPRQVGPRHLQLVWNGEPLEGKRVLVRCYHGLGDTVQFIRFAAPLRSIAKEVIVWAQPELVRLIGMAAGVDRALPLHDGAPDVDYDIDIEVMELAHALRVNAQTIPRAVPYLFPSGRARRLTSSSEPAIGLVWQAGGWDARRSLSASALSPLAAVSDVRLFSLQRGPTAADASVIPAHDIGSNDIDEVAATLRSLDLLITVDTFIAHLAGALGIPVWLLLHMHSDWRWMENRADCLWYPTMRLFRQRRAGDWHTVIADVTAALRSLSACGESDSRPSEQTIPANVRLA
jgi:hypothetical protein